MTPEELSARLKRIAATIDSSERPSMATISSELNFLLSQVSPAHRAKLPSPRTKPAPLFPNEQVGVSVGSSRRSARLELNVENDETYANTMNHLSRRASKTR